MTQPQVTLLQLEQRYGSSPDAKEFIDELIKGPNQYLVGLLSIVYDSIQWLFSLFWGGDYPSCHGYLN